MKKILFIIIILSAMKGYTQYFVPFGKDSLWRPNSWSVIEAMYKDSNQLYIGGVSCIYGGPNQINNIGVWDNNEWTTFDNGFGSANSGTTCFMKYKDFFYMGGFFSNIQNIPQTGHICRFNGTNWEAVANSYGEVNSNVFDMVVFDTLLIVGGGFSTIGSQYGNFNRIAAYNGTDYINIGSFIGFGIYALAVYNNELYAGGGMMTIQKYLGNQQWEDVGGNFDYWVQDMQVDTFNNLLYVCGGFNVADDTIETDNIAVWDGFRWTKIGYGSGDVNNVNTMAFYRGDLYCNTNNTTAGGVYTGYLPKWDGTDWSPGVPGGLNFEVNSLVVFDDMLYIGGGATGPGPMDTAQRTLARW
ncbi:MAG: hypothetical protein ABIJ97_12905, partial [Bacteroidota bacterium]